MFIPLTTKPQAALRPDASKISQNDWDVLADFWYPVAVSAQLRDKPTAVQLLDVDLVLFRGREGTPGVAVDLCPHRHIRLSTGRVMDGEIVCPFHGMRFDPAGRCRLPALGRSERLPASYSVRTFPARERYGLIWTCLGNPREHDIPHIPALGAVPADELDFLGPQSWPVSAPRQVENFFDLGHLPLVHVDTIGGDAASAMRPGTVENSDDAVMLRVEYVEKLPGGDPRPCEFTYRMILPFTIDFRILDHTTGALLYALNIPSPASAYQSRVFQVFRATDAALSPDRQSQQNFMNAFAAINEEDIEVLSGLRTPDLPLDQHHEVHLPVDNICGAYRARLRELGLGRVPHATVGSSKRSRAPRNRKSEPQETRPHPG